MGRTGWVCKPGGKRKLLVGKRGTRNLNQKGDEMDGTTIIRVVSGMLFVLVLAVLIWRRKRTA